MAEALFLDEHDLKSALEDADIPVLLMVLTHLTGDDRWLQEPYLPKRDTRIFPDESGGLTPELQDAIRSAAFDVLRTPGLSADGVPIDEARYARMMSVCVGEDVPAEYVPLFLEEMGVTRSAPTLSTDDDHSRAPMSVLIVGAGVSGMSAAIALQAKGIDFEIVDKNLGLGGTWFENTYPESGVDTPNHFYSYSFRPNLNWTSYFSKQPEVLAYLEECAAHYGIADRIRLQTTVLASQWREDEQRWVTTVEGPDGSREDLVSNAVMFAVGQLNRPSIPDFEGFDTFAGEWFHTAQWRHDIDLQDKRVAIIGTGASAMQIARTVAAKAASTTIFQRSPQWIAPNPDYHRTVSERKLWLLANVPFYAKWYRFVVFWRYGDGLLRSLYKDPDWPHPGRSVSRANDRHRKFFTGYLLDQLGDRTDLIAKSLPTYPPYGKRMLVDNFWFATILRDDVELVTQGVQRMTSTGIETVDGRQFDVDIIIMATGFQPRRMIWPIKVMGRERPLHEVWTDDDASAYLGITVPGFPNMFLMHGPNTALAHGGSIIFHAECQTRYVVDLLEQMIAHGLGAADCKQAIHDAYVERVDALHATLIWTHPGMTNWYRNEHGRIVATSPWRLVDYWALTHHADLDDYEVEMARRVDA